MATTAKHPRKAVQSRRSTADQQHAAEDEVFSQMPLKELLQQLHVAVEDLAALDASLTALFDGAPNTDVTEHQQLVQFRSRVARRISRYGQLTKGLAQLVERVIACSTSQSQGTPHPKDPFSPKQLRELEFLLKQHQQRLQKYKSQFAAWWQNTERHFHTMRMVNYVCSVQERALATSGLGPRDGVPAGPTRFTAPRVDSARTQTTCKEHLSAVEPPQTAQEDPGTVNAVRKLTQPQQHSQQLLHETRQVMVQEVQRMQATQEQLQQSSGVLEQTEATYNVFGARLSSATGILQALKKRSATDSELIWLAFLFFLGCCAFVVLRRLGIMRLMIRVVSFSLHHVLALTLGMTERVLMVLSQGWESSSWEKSPEQVIEVTKAFQGAHSPAAQSISVGASDVSKLFAASATIAVSATPSQKHREGRATARELESFAAGEGGSRATGMEDHAPKSGKRRAQNPGDGSASAYATGNPSIARKLHKIVDVEASATSRGDAALPSTPQKPPFAASARGSINGVHLSSRQQ